MTAPQGGAGHGSVLVPLDGSEPARAALPVAEGLARALGANLHVQLVYGEEPHHVAEAIFKGLARALDVATQIEPRAADLLPSTKGKL